MYLDDASHSGLVYQWEIQWLFSDPLPFLSKGCEMLSERNQPLPVDSTHPLITIHPSFRGVIHSTIYLILLPFKPYKNTTKTPGLQNLCVGVC